mmetsp:Transcript_122253/g.191767  ORF Transcript_122253/g.191767 Transcript_122253/m.191767 type:complete len:105 (+) Transcript_122253:1179-1493(+)
MIPSSLGTGVFGVMSSGPSQEIKLMYSVVSVKLVIDLSTSASLEARLRDSRLLSLSVLVRPFLELEEAVVEVEESVLVDAVDSRGNDMLVFGKGICWSALSPPL